MVVGKCAIFWRFFPNIFELIVGGVELILDECCGVLVRRGKDLRERRV